jgi:hypothetical protein
MLRSRSRVDALLRDCGGRLSQEIKRKRVMMLKTHRHFIVNESWSIDFFLNLDLSFLDAGTCRVKLTYMHLDAAQLRHN